MRREDEKSLILTNSRTTNPFSLLSDTIWQRWDQCMLRTETQSFGIEAEETCYKLWYQVHWYEHLIRSCSWLHLITGVISSRACLLNFATHSPREHTILLLNTSIDHVIHTPPNQRNNPGTVSNVLHPKSLILRMGGTLGRWIEIWIEIWV